MALRKPVFLRLDDGAPYNEEMAATDSMELGGLTMSGNIAMGSNKVTGLAAANASGQALVYGQSAASLAGLTMGGDIAMAGYKVTGLGTPTTGGDAATKTYVDQLVISGGHLREALLDQAQLSDSQGILAAEVLYFTAQPVVGDTVIFKDGTLTRTYTFVANQGAEAGATDVSIETSAVTAMQRLVTRAMADAGNTQWDLAWRATGVERINLNGAIIVYDRATAAGASASRIYGVWATQANAQVVQYASGATPTVALDYTSVAATNLPAADPAAGRFGLRKQTTALQDGDLHYLLDNDSIYGWNADTAHWQAMGGSASVPDATSATGGGTKGKVTVDSDYGLIINSGILTINLDTNPGLAFNGAGPKKLAAKPDTAAGIKVGAGGIGVDITSNAGLQFNGVSGKLEVLANAAQGINVGASGVGITLASNGGLEFNSGLKVLPNGAKGIALSSSGVEAKVDNSTIGFDGSGNLKALAVAASNAVENSLPVNEAISIGDPVYISSTNDRVAKSDAGVSAKARVMGVARTAQGTPGSNATIVSMGPAANVLSSATAGTPYYLQDGGGEGTALPGAGKRIVQTGYAKNATDLFVFIIDYGKRAA